MEHVVQGSVPVKTWDPDKPFIDELVDKGTRPQGRTCFTRDWSADEPVILRHTVVDYWAARDAWDTNYLKKHIGLKQVRPEPDPSFLHLAVFR